MDLSKRELQRLAAEFYADDHRFWEKEQKPPHPNMARNRKEDWDQKREKMQVEMEAFSEEMSEDEKDLHSQLAVENRSGTIIGNSCGSFRSLRKPPRWIRIPLTMYFIIMAWSFTAICP